ncbi:hypothetical protein [Photorhabdus heterorhabditis]|uniref:hypothetical protein n=1 Tax=Photorhabdus heterorhabditis TaxID=880156 RepID=UPI001FCF854B|nr:hypothetical protein [Photorhabdus heterorhabditis]
MYQNIAGVPSSVAEKGATLTNARWEKPVFGGEKRVWEFWVQRQSSTGKTVVTD